MAVPPTKEITTAATLQPFVTSGLAACTASACIHPIDLAKGQWLFLYFHNANTVVVSLYCYLMLKHY